MEAFHDLIYNTRPRRSDDLAANTKFPIILLKKHHVTQLIVKYHHKMERHEMGVNYTLNHLRERKMPGYSQSSRGEGVYSKLL